MARDITFDIIARDKASKVFDKVGHASNGLEKRFGGIGKVAKVGFGAAAAAGAALTTGLGASIAKAMDYDKTMRLVGATLGTTGEQQKSLGALALKMGADTVFSAADAGNAMLELAKGGLTTAQIQGGALNATMTLAAAGTLEMGAAATYVGNAINTFGLKAKDAGAVAAALAGGANASSASVESLGLALSQVGPGARTAGLSIQTTTAILAAFDNAGIKGADAGTSLKTMLTRLVPQTKAARNAMHDLGLKFTDSKGQFVSMANVAEQLKTKMGGLSDQERTTAMNRIFGSDATRAATVLMNLGSAGVEKYTKATSDQAAAQKMANTQMEGASGAWEAFKGSVETLAIQIGVKLLPTSTRVLKWLTEVTNNISTKAGPTVQRFSAWFKNDLWPALQKGYQTIMPGVQRALAILKGGVDGNSVSWKQVGDVIVNKVIPVLAKVISVYLPMLAAQWRVIIGVVRTVWNVFETLMGVISKVVTFILRRFADVTSMFAAMLRALSHVPGFGWAKTAADKLQTAADKARGLANAINNIDRNVAINVVWHDKGSTPGSRGIKPSERAVGGPVVAGRPYIVGENEPELFIPSQSGRILNQKQMRSAASSGGSGIGGGDVFNIVLGPGSMREQAQQFITEIRAIRRQTGVDPLAAT